MNNLLMHKKNFFSQNGEDGIIKIIFQEIGEKNRTCCEFGAWDGIYLSNCRQLILNGWEAVMIEGDPEKFLTLEKSYENNKNVHCVNTYVDVTENTVSYLCKNEGFEDLDFLSIDIDGLDYEIFSSMNLRPRVVCVEVNAGHSPNDKNRIVTNLAMHNVGQPLGLFSETAKEMGYSLVCYSGNAFYVRDDILKSSTLEKISNEDAYSEFLEFLDEKAKVWLYLVNRGIVGPIYIFQNSFLSKKKLEINGKSIRAEIMKASRKVGMLKTISRLILSKWIMFSGKQHSLR